MKNETIVLLDFKGSLMRAYHACQAEKTVPGKDGSFHLSWKAALAAYIDIELPHLFEFTAPKNVVVVKDGGSRYRKTLYSGYKKKREEKKEQRDPAENEQIKRFAEEAEKLLLHLGAKTIVVENQEADDVIALSAKSLSKNSPVIIRTNDADLLQLAEGNTRVQMLQNLEVFSEGDEYKGVPLYLLRLHKSLVGDKSDEYLGVPQFGDVAWESCVAAYGFDGMQQIEQCVATGDMTMLEGAYQATGDKQLKKILDNLAEWKMCYNLATLHPEVCYRSINNKLVAPEISARLPSKEVVKDILDEVGYKGGRDFLYKHLPRFRLIEGTEAGAQELQEVMQEVAQGTARPAYDFESYDSVCNPNYQKAAKMGRYVDVLAQKITGVSICYGENYEHTVYVPFDHRDTDNFPQAWKEWLLKSLYQCHDRPVAQNASFELAVGRMDVGHFPEHAPYDTAVMASYADENMQSGLKSLSKEIFGYDQATYAETLGDRNDMRELSGKEVLNYGCDDSLVTAHLYDYFYLVTTLEGSYQFYENNEVDWILDYVTSFCEGTDIDYDFMKSCEDKDRALMNDCETRLVSLLTKHATDPKDPTRAQRAQGLFFEELNYLYVANGFSESNTADDELISRMATAKQRLWESMYQATVYTPYKEEKVVKSFSPTVKQINEIFSALGMPESTHLEKITQKYLQAWVVENDKLLSDLSGDAGVFVQELIASSRYLTPAKRGTEEYLRFEKAAMDVRKKYDIGTVTVTESSGDPLNFGSPKQMQKLLYVTLGLPIRSRSKVQPGSTRDTLRLPGAPATGNAAISSAIAYDVEDGDWRKEVLELYEKIVETQQTISLFYTPYPLWKSTVDEKIHPQIKNCGTVTRRPSGTSPNILQVSAKDGAKIRKCFTSWKMPEKYVYVGADFASQELQIAGVLSKDPTMLAAFTPETKKNLHSVTAVGIVPYIAKIKGSPEGMPETLDYEVFEKIRNGVESSIAKFFESARKSAKAVNFLTIYMGSAMALAERLKVPVELAQDMIDGFFKTYPGYRKWVDEQIEKVKICGYVETLYGNRRHLNNDIFSDNMGKASRVERQAANSPVQGTAADVLKIVLSRLRKHKVVEKYHVRSIFPVYDELAVRVPLAAAAEYCEEVNEHMQVILPGFEFPFGIDMAIGTSWGSVKEIGGYDRGVVAETLDELTQEGTTDDTKNTAA